MNRELKQALSQWDGKSGDDIAAIYDDCAGQAAFIETILALTRETALQAGATWLLKKHLENRNRLNEAQIRTLWSLAGGLDQWEARLHVLQCLPFLPIGVSQKDEVAQFLRQSLDSKNKFVRAWAYGGFIELAGQHPEFEKETEDHLRRALDREAASVKARIRQAARKHPRWRFYAGV